MKTNDKPRIIAKINISNYLPIGVNSINTIKNRMEKIESDLIPIVVTRDDLIESIDCFLKYKQKSKTKTILDIDGTYNII